MITNSIIDEISNQQVEKQEITIPLDKTPAVNLIFNSKCISPRPQSKLIFLFYFTFILSINHFDCSQPDLGSLYDCSNVTKVGLYSVPPETYCSQFHLKDIRNMAVEVQKYYTNIKLFLCSTEKIVLFCHEKFLDQMKRKCR